MHPWFDDPAMLTAAAAVLVVAYFIRGITGFGSGLIAVPLLALFQPLTFVVPLMLLLDFTASTLVGGLHLRRVRWAEILPLFPFSIVGVAVGAHLLIGLPHTPMLVALALFILAFSVRSLLDLHGEKPVSRAWGVPASLVGGAVGGLFGTGGPPYVIYMNHRMRDKSELRATLSALFFFEGLVRIVTFVVAGLLAVREVWVAYVACLPVVLGALWLGGHAHLGVSRPQMNRLVGGLLLVAGVSLLWKALA